MATFCIVTAFMTILLVIYLAYAITYVGTGYDRLSKKLQEAEKEQTRKKVNGL